MKRILRSRLPERLADRVPPLLIEVAIGLAMPVVMTLLRLALVPWIADLAPYALVFVAAVGATVLAGWRSGLIAVVIGQSLAWYLIVDPATDAADNADIIGGLAVATFSQLVAVVIIWLYQREVDKAWAQREGQFNLLDKALREIDHRTVNNYQAVLSLILAQAKRAKDDPVKEALNQVADRIRAIASASSTLALSSQGLEHVRIGGHLQQLCGQIEKGLFRPGVRLVCDFADVPVDAERTTSVAILVNELVTNALKHGFPDNREGIIEVSLKPAGDGLDLVVADNGVGVGGSMLTRGSGLGNRLIKTFTKQLRARHEVETGGSGTRHRIHFPLAA